MLKRGTQLIVGQPTVAEARVAKALRAWRTEYRWSQDQVAHVIGSNRDGVRLIEGAHHRAVGEVADKLRRLLTTQPGEPPHGQSELPVVKEQRVLGGAAAGMETRRIWGHVLNLMNRVKFLESQWGECWKPGTAPEARKTEHGNGALDLEARNGS